MGEPTQRHSWKRRRSPRLHEEGKKNLLENSLNGRFQRERHTSRWDKGPADGGFRHGKVAPRMNEVQGRKSKSRGGKKRDNSSEIGWHKKRCVSRRDVRDDVQGAEEGRGGSTQKPRSPRSAATGETRSVESKRQSR